MKYPVMLYLGSLTNYAIAHDEDEADNLQEAGYITHEEVMKLEPKLDGAIAYAGQAVGSGIAGSAGSSDELAEAYKDIETMEKTIEVKDREISDLKGELDKANERYEEKERELVELKNQPGDDSDSQEIADLKSKLAIYEETKAVTGDGVTSYDQMTNANLHKLLDSRDAEYNKRDDKDALIQAAKDSE